MKTVRILGIAPYEGLHDMMKSMASFRQDIDLKVYIGDFMEGLQLVQSEDLSAYDVIISRGGTADAIRAVSPLPVVSIPLSYYDILNAIKLAQNYDGAYAIVGFPSTASFAKMLCDILHYDIAIYTTNSEEESHTYVDQLKADGYSLVLGDTMICSYARQAGLNAILITSCSESISTAFDQAVEFCQYYSRIQEENFYHRTLLSMSPNTVLVCSPTGEILFSNLQAQKNQTLVITVKKLIPSLMKEGSLQVLRQISGGTLLITGKKLSLKGQVTLYFSVSHSQRADRLKKWGIETKSCTDISNRFIDIFYNSGTTAELRKKAISYGTFLSPILICGERGTGKDRFAEFIYINSRNTQGFLYTIDCGMLDQKALTFMLNRADSPFFEKNHTFYIKDLNKLPQQQAQLLLDFLYSSRLSAANQLIFSTQHEAHQTDTSPLEIFLTDRLECLTLELPPLRQRIHEIPGLISLYLSELNTQLPKQVIGVEPEGMSLLQGFRWEQNLTQMRKILAALVQVTTTPYIRTEDVHTILREELRHTTTSTPANTAININQPLDDIIFDVINLVLSQENMTQTKAAKQLGICRTTLWKYLKR